MGDHRHLHWPNRSLELLYPDQLFLFHCTPVPELDSISGMNVPDEGADALEITRENIAVRAVNNSKEGFMVPAVRSGIPRRLSHRTREG